MEIGSLPNIGPEPGAAARLSAAAARTVRWLARAADEPMARHPEHLPETLDFRPWAELFLHTYRAAPAGTEIGFPIVLRGDALDFPTELASRARYHAYLEGGRFLGTFHVHPPDRPPFFDPGDLAAALRSDNAGFIDLLLARERLYALVRANPYLYISAHHVNRNPLLLQEAHEALLRRQSRLRAGRRVEEPPEGDEYRRASLYYFARYQLALYEGRPGEPLRRTVTPGSGW